MPIVAPIAPIEPIEQAYFPASGVVSIVATTTRGRHAEAGVVGREGVSGTCLLLVTEIALSHAFMGKMISAERSGVTVTLHILEGAGMIRSRRGRVTILVREKLEALADDGYGVPEAKYRLLIGPFGREPTLDAGDATGGFPA